MKSYQWYLLGIVFLFCLISVTLFEKITVSGGLGWDGWTYNQILMRFKEIIVGGNITAYCLKRSLPLAVTYFLFKIVSGMGILMGFTSLTLTVPMVIACFSLWSTLAITGSNFYLFKIYDKFEFERNLQIICFLLFNLTYVVAKFPFFYPVLTDHLAILIVTASMYAYFFEKPKFLLTLFLIGYFTFPTLFLVAGILFIFPYGGTVRRVVNITKKHIFYAFISVFSVAMPIAFYKLDVINALIVDTHKFFLLFIDNKLLINGESEVNTMLVPLSIVLVFAYIVSIALIFKPLDILQQIIQKIYIKRLALIGFLLICLSQIIKYRSTGVGFSDVDFARNLITQSIKQPLGFYLSHFSYFGVAFILPFLYYKYCSKILRIIGLGAVLVMLFHLILMIGSESRQFLAFFPFLIIFSGLLIKDFFLVNQKMILIIAVMSFVLSTLWLPINQTISYKRLNEIDMPYLYAIHQGPWMPSEFYYLLVPVCISTIILLKCALRLHPTGPDRF